MPVRHVSLLAQKPQLARRVQSSHVLASVVHGSAGPSHALDTHAQSAQLPASGPLDEPVAQSPVLRQ